MQQPRDDGTWLERYIGMPLVEEESYDCNDLVF